MRPNPLMALLFLFSAPYCSVQANGLRILLLANDSSGVFVKGGIPDFTLESDQLITGAYVEVHYFDDNGEVFYKQISERFGISPGEVVNGKSALVFREVDFNGRYFLARNEVPGTYIVRLPRYRACIYLKQYSGEEITLAGDCRKHENVFYHEITEQDLPEEKKSGSGFSERMPIGIGSGQAEYYMRYSNDNFFGDERPLFYQTLVLNTSMDVAGLPLRSAITLTNGEFSFRQNPNVIRFEFDPQAYRQKQETKLNNAAHLENMKRADYSRQLDSITGLLRGIDHTLQSPDFQRQLVLLNQKDSLDHLLQYKGELLDSSEFHEILEQRKNLSDSMPQEKYLKKLVKAKAVFEESRDVLAKLSAQQDSLLSQIDTVNTDTLNLNKPKTQAVHNVLGKVSDLGVGTVFMPVSNYSISGAPIQGFKTAMKFGDIHYTVATGKLNRNTLHGQQMHEIRNKSWISIAGIEKRTSVMTLKFHYLNTIERNDLGEILRRNHVIPIQLEYRLGSRLFSRTELSVSSLFSREVEQSIYHEFLEEYQDSGIQIVRYPNISRLGLAFKQSFEYRLLKQVQVQYSLETITRNYHSIPQPFLMTGITNQEFGAKMNFYKNRVRMYSGFVYSVREEEGKRYTRSQPKLRIQLAFPRKPTLNVDYIPVFMQVYDRKYSTSLVNIGSNYVWKHSGTVFISNGNHSRMLVLQQGTVTLVRQTALMQSLERARWATSFGLLWQNNQFNQMQVSNRYFQADVRFKVGEQWTVKGRGQFGARGDSRAGFGAGLEYLSKKAFLIRADYRNELVNRYDITNAVLYEKEIYSFTLQLIKRW